jgi:hypothetical protein
MGNKGTKNLQIESATFGNNCSGDEKKINTNNVMVKKYVKQLCDTQSICPIKVDSLILGNPVEGCIKELNIKYSCGQTGPSNTKSTITVLEGTSINIGCEQFVPITCQTSYRQSFYTADGKLHLF